MRITPINNQRANNKPAFGMAVKRVNTAGMTNLEKQAVLECLPELKTMFKTIDAEIMLDTQPNLFGRQFKVLATDLQNANKKVYEAISNGIHYHSGDKVGLNCLKNELFKNAEASAKTFLAKNKNIENDVLDDAIAEQLNTPKVIGGSFKTLL